MRLKMALLWCEVLVKSVLAKKFRKSLVFAIAGSKRKKSLFRQLAPFCVGVICSDVTGAIPWQSHNASAATLASLPKTIEVQTNPLFSNQFPGKTAKPCSLEANPSPWTTSRYYWLQPNPCAEANKAESTTPIAAESSEPATPRTLTSALVERGSFKAALKVQELEQDSLLRLSKKEGEKNGTPPLETWKTLTYISAALLPSVDDNKSDTILEHHSARVLNSGNLFNANLPTSTSSSPEETSLLQKPLVFKGAALLAGNYKRAEIGENSKSLQVESQSPVSSHPPAIENNHCPAPLISCAPSLQAQTPPVPPQAPLVPPGNLQPNPNQDRPNQDRFLQPPPTPAPITPDKPSIQPPPTPTPSVQPSPTPQPSTPSNSPTFQVQKIQVSGSSVFGPNQLNPIVQPFEGRALTLEQLREVADAITQLYLNQGYITSRAILVDQAITNGVVEIRVLEGSLEDIQIEGARRVKPNYIRRRVQLGAKTPLNTAQLEDQLRLLRADPLFENVEASLRAGTRLGQSILIVRVVEANPFEGSVGIDNYSPPSVGSERLGLNAIYRNLTGNGDALAGSYYHTTRSGADNLDLSYRLPVNAMNGAVQLRTSLSWNKVVESDFSFFNIEGESQLYEISFQQPLIRSPREEFALSLGFSYQKSKALAGPFPISPGANAEGFTTTNVIRFGQDYLRRDVKGAWSLRSLFSFGVDLFDATTNSPPVPDGGFFSWLGQVQRVQVLGDNNFLIAGVDIQLTPDRLLPSQQFVIGGGQSLRGYRQNIRAGDNGVRFSLEDRIALERNEAGIPVFQVAPFFDAGVVWNNDTRNRPLPSQNFLAGLGLGIIWEPIPRLSIRLDYAYPLIDLEDRGNNAQDEGFYFNVRYQF